MAGLARPVPRPRWLVAFVAALLVLLVQAIAAAVAPPAWAQPTPSWQSTFVGPGLDGDVTAATVWDDGGGPALYVGGRFTTAGDEVVHNIARWDGTGWSALAGPSGTGVDGPAGGQVLALAVFDGALVVGGAFDEAGGIPADNVARWDGTDWSALDAPDEPGVDNQVQALLAHDGLLYVGGTFTLAGGDDACTTPDVLSCANWIASWDGSQWGALNGPTGIGISGTIRALAVFDGDLVAAGGFLEVAGAPANGIARWDGTD